MRTLQAQGSDALADSAAKLALADPAATTSSMEALREDNLALRQDNLALRQDIAALRQDNAALRFLHEQLMAVARLGLPSDD